MLVLKPVIIIAIAFVLLIPVNVFAEEGRPQQEGVYYQKDSDGNYREVWNFPDYTCQPDCTLTMLLDKKPSLGEEYPRYQLGETVKILIQFFSKEYYSGEEIQNVEIDVWGNTHEKYTFRTSVEEPLVFEYKIEDDFNIGEYKLFAKVKTPIRHTGYYNQESFFTVYDPSHPPEQPENICGMGTMLKDGQCVPESPLHGDPEPSSKGGGCLIATATYGSELAPQVQQLRELRDNQLLNTKSGTSFMESFNDFYYSFSPIIADYERENPVFKEMVKIAITPMITSLSILNYVDMDSEQSVLGYGISLIILNGMMYVGIPILVIMKMRNEL